MGRPTIYFRRRRSSSSQNLPPATAGKLPAGKPTGRKPFCEQMERRPYRLAVFQMRQGAVAGPWGLYFNRRENSELLVQR